MSITKAFEEGQEAAALNKSKTDCPYPTDSQEGKDWHEGFDDRNDTNDMQKNSSLLKQAAKLRFMRSKKRIMSTFGAGIADQS